MDSGVSTTMRARKVIYDDYTNAFYVESRVEALERQVATRAKLTDVLNRSQDTRLKDQTKRVKAEKEIFEKKNERETLQHRELLKDHVAHRSVLNDIARSRVIDSITGTRAQSHLGQYGLGASRLEIQPLIENTIKENTPAAKRLRKSWSIQNKRRAITLFDRTKSTSALLKMKQQMKSRPTSEITAKKKAEPSDTSGRLILPPITVRWSKQRPRDCSTSQAIRGDKDGHNTLPTIFVTQGSFL